MKVFQRMIMHRHCLLVLSWFLVFNHLGIIRGNAKDLAPDDIIASVDGNPVYVGELNLILAERFRNQPLDSIDVDLKRAACHLLAQRRLALRALRKVGGEPLAQMVQNEIDAFILEAKRRGSTLQHQAKARSSDAASLIVDLSWRVAWGAYLKSKLTDENLRRYFESNATSYNGTRYRISQIFIRPASTSEVDIVASVKSLSSLASEIQTADQREIAFADAARQYSESSTAQNGGDLGWVESDGDLPAGLMKEVRKLPVGSVSRPLRSPLGVHLLFLHELEKGSLTFEELTDISLLRRDAANAMFEALVESEAETEVVWHLDALKPPSDQQ